MTKRSIHRRQGNRPTKNKVQILTEGEATEIEYLRYICNAWGLPKELVVIEKSTHTDPKGIIDEIIGKKRDNIKRARRGQEPLVDQWWVICDTEGRPEELTGAILEAQSNGILIAFSDISIEFWFRLHFGYTTRQYNSVLELIKELSDEKWLPEYSDDNKHPDMAILFPRLAEAMKNARLLRQNHTSMGEPRPLTDIDLVIDALLEIAGNVNAPFNQMPFNQNALSMYQLQQPYSVNNPDPHRANT